MLKDAGFAVRDFNMKAYMQVRTLTQEFIDDFLGYYNSPKNREMNSLLIQQYIRCDRKCSNSRGIDLIVAIKWL
jgi:hypothetical protein